MPNIFLVDVLDDGFRLRLVGSELALRAKADPSDQTARLFRSELTELAIPADLADVRRPIADG